MKFYEKPIILLNEELSEGVYAASGAVSPSGPSGPSGPSASGGGVSATVNVSNNDTWNKVIDFTVTIQNNGSETATDWSVSLHVTGTPISLTNYDSNYKATLSGNTITITPVQWGDISVGGSKTVGLKLSYSGDSISIA